MECDWRFLNGPYLRIKMVCQENVRKRFGWGSLSEESLYKCHHYHRYRVSRLKFCGQIFYLWGKTVFNL